MVYQIEMPRFRGLGDFNRKISTLREEQPNCACGKSGATSSRSRASGASARAVTIVDRFVPRREHGLDRDPRCTVAGAPVSHDGAPQEGAFPLIAFDEMDGAACPPGEQDRDHQPGKPGAGAEVEPATAPREPGRAVERCRRHAGARSAGACSGRQGSEPPPIFGASATKRSSLSRVSRETSDDPRRAPAASSAADVGHATRRGAPRLASARISVKRRRRHPVDPRRLAERRRPGERELLAQLVRQARKRAVVESSGSGDRLVAPVVVDIGGLPVEIDGIFGVGLELFGDARLDRGRAPARSAASVAMSTSGWARSSKALRRTPSWLRWSPVVRASFGVRLRLPASCRASRRAQPPWRR